MIDVHGVGYEVQVAREDYSSGEAARLFIYTVVRDDAIVLYGFVSVDERELFEMLLATPGVGPATALGALRTMSVVELAAAIESGDAKRVAQIPGIGPKTANRIVLELKGKVVVAADARVTSATTTRSRTRCAPWATTRRRSATPCATCRAGDESATLREALHRLRPR